TAPQEAEEITVVARVYDLHPAIVQPLGAFLDEVRDGLPIFSGRLVDAGPGGYPGTDEYGSGYGGEMMGDAYGMDMSAAMGPVAPPAPTKLRILAPAAAQAVLGELLTALQPD